MKQEISCEQAVMEILELVQDVDEKRLADMMSAMRPNKKYSVKDYETLYVEEVSDTSN